MLESLLPNHIPSKASPPNCQPIVLVQVGLQVVNEAVGARTVIKEQFSEFCRARLDLEPVCPKAAHIAGQPFEALCVNLA